MAKGVGKFQIVSKYTPSGDQPTAIASLVEGLNKGERMQTLLGATGTGKSVAWDEPVTVHRGGDDYYRGPIGALVDHVMNNEPQWAESVEATPPSTWRVLAWDATTGATAWRRITALSRHDAPETMYTLSSACGRRVSVTGDHSIWALRDGALQLLLGGEVLAGDAIPIPRQIPAPIEPLRSLDLLSLLVAGRANCHASVPPECAAPATFQDALMPFYAQPREKAWRVRNENERISIPAMQHLVQMGVVKPEAVRVCGKRYDAPALVPLTPELGFVFGQYIAEGHSAERFTLFSVRDADTQSELARTLQESRIPFFRKPDGDFVVVAAAWRPVFDTLMGALAGVKRLPAFWTATNNLFLGSLLRGYFEGDGGVDGGAVTAVTLSVDLAYDVAEALLRFGIWGRVRRVRKKKPNGDTGVYHKITVSGADNLRRFETEIGFHSVRKREALTKCVARCGDGNTNVDCILGVGARFRAERQSRSLHQCELAARTGCARSTISAIERGVRHPSRALLVKLCCALDMKDAAFAGLADVFWSPVESVVTHPPCGKFVYDFSVDEYETFLTGRGGLFVHNTFSVANVIEKVQRPTLVIAHNKTLAAQLCSEFREFFPNNAVEYFVSYYDYYQPEAYIPQTDTFIEKDSSINDEIDRLRHSATQALLSRRDVIVVASVSCIYGLGSPDSYKNMQVWFHTGQEYDRDDILRRLVRIQFQRNDVALTRGTFRVKGDVLEVQPKDEEILFRVEFDFDTVSRISVVDPLTGELIETRDELTVYPASHFVTDPDKMESILQAIEAEMVGQKKLFEAQGKLIEAQRIEQRTRFDLEMIREVGFCSGIENYSRWMDGRPPGTAPHTLFDYFPDDMLLLVDESHQTIPQLHAMFAGDKRRKDTLVDFGFRLPSARDNRPLRFEEWEERIKQVIFISATPGPYEKQHSSRMPEQIIRPTGLIDPEIVIRPTKGQIDDLISELKKRTDKGERVLVTTLTKKMAEDLTEYLIEIGTKVQYLHSDIHTLERTEILRDLRLGVYDVVVGINLLREGLDLPEVSLVAILDADKEGFLRSETSLVQTIGRAARNVGGQVIMYADRITGSMERAIDETNRRKVKQEAYNAEHGITPQTVIKAVRDVLESKKVAEAKSYYKVQANKAPETLPLDQILIALSDMEKEMKQAARALDFEHAAQLRDDISRLKKLVPTTGGKR